MEYLWRKCSSSFEKGFAETFSWSSRFHERFAASFFRDAVACDTQGLRESRVEDCELLPRDVAPDILGKEAIAARSTQAGCS